MNKKMTKNLTENRKKRQTVYKKETVFKHT